jgi:hypothetical protein
VRRLVIAGLALLTACAGNPGAPGEGFDKQIVLAPRQSVTVAELQARIHFAGVTGDSRCPADAICIQGGDAVVHIELRSFDGRAIQYELHTGSLQPVVHGDVTIALETLEPYPFSSRPIEPSDYRATLRLSRP